MKQESYYVYLITDIHRKTLLSGFTHNLVAFMEHLSKCKVLLFDAHLPLNKLIYIEKVSSEMQANEKATVLNTFSRIQKERLIKEQNPNWLNLKALVLLDS